MTLLLLFILKVGNFEQVHLVQVRNQWNLSNLQKHFCVPTFWGQGKMLKFSNREYFEYFDESENILRGGSAAFPVL